MKKKISGIIPARYNSLRFPGKPLAEINGKPMIRRVYEQARLSKKINELFVATDDSGIFETVIGFGGKAVMTSPEAKTGTDRILEALKAPELIDSEIVINIQGDEPLIDPSLIDLIATNLTKYPETPVFTAATNLEENQSENENIVKVVTGKLNQDHNSPLVALYFSRSKIPFIRGHEINENPYLRHIGIYGFQKKALEEFNKLPDSRLEKLESLEQLRMVEYGWKIGIILTEYQAIGVDLLSDIAIVEEELKRKGMK